MQRLNVICLVLDRLHAGYLGAYGNTWINTPALDRLAAQSFICDGAIIDSPDLATAYRSLWLGRHACCLSGSEAQDETLPAIFARNGWQTTLLTDDATVAEHPLAAGFQEKIFLKPAEDLQGRGGQVQVSASAEETDAAKFFAAVVEELTSTSEPYLAWIHTDTLGRVWDAPLAFREQFADKDDPEAADWANVPERILPDEFDPDELLPITHAYAGQVSLLDELVDSFSETLSKNSGGADETLFVLFSPRGFPLGEHHRVGSCDDALYAELTHVPLMIRIPGQQGGSNRSRALVQPADLSTTILDCCGLRYGDAGAAVVGAGRSFLPIIQGQSASEFDRACVAADNQQVFVTPGWSLRVSTEGTSAEEESAAKAAEEKIELFVKPDDWVEINNVADRCPEIVEEMRGTMSEFIDACRADEPAVLAALPDELIHFE